MTVGIDASAITEAGVYTDTLVVSDGATTQRIVVALRLLPPGAPTSELFGLEVTQGIQNLFNDIPFVAERPAFVRAHVRSLTGLPVEKATAELISSAMVLS